MPREITAFPLSLPAPPARGNLYRWLYGELRAAILDGRLRPGSRLPATRDLAAAYRLSRSTIVTAFEQLKSEGYVEGRSGSGTYVSEVLPEHLLDVRGPKPEKRLPHRRIALSAYARRLQPFRGTAVRPMRAFRPNQPALDLFPTDLWAQVAARRLRRVSANLLAGGEALGYRPLREAVAAYLNTSRGVKCTAEQVLILSGAQEALDRTARILLNPGESVWMEEPGYPGAGVVFRALGAQIRRVPVDAEGLSFEIGRKRWLAPRLVYVTPGHQFPLGVTMSLRRRLALLEWARRSGVLIFEDDYDSEYRYCGPAGARDAGIGSVGRRDLRGQLQRGAFPCPAARLPGGARGDGGCVCGGGVGQYAPSSASGASGIVRLHHRRAFRAAYPENARDLCGAVAGVTGKRQRKARRGARNLGSRGGVADCGLAEAWAISGEGSGVWPPLAMSRSCRSAATHRGDRAGRD